MTATPQDRLARARDCLVAAQQRQKAYADKGRRDTEFSTGQPVLLSTRNITHKGPGTPKLMPKWIGPFRITERIGAVAYKLELPPVLRIHDVFHASLLKAYRSDGRVHPPPVSLTTDGDPLYEVDFILGDRWKTSGKHKWREYHTQWTGYGPEHNTWEPESSFETCPDVIQAYWDQKDGHQRAHRGTNGQYALQFYPVQSQVPKTSGSAADDSGTCQTCSSSAFRSTCAHTSMVVHCRAKTIVHRETRPYRSGRAMPVLQSPAQLYKCIWLITRHFSHVHCRGVRRQEASNLRRGQCNDSKA